MSKKKMPQRSEVLNHSGLHSPPLTPSFWGKPESRNQIPALTGMTDRFLGACVEESSSSGFGFICSSGIRL